MNKERLKTIYKNRYLFLAVLISLIGFLISTGINEIIFLIIIFISLFKLIIRFDKINKDKVDSEHQ